MQFLIEDDQLLETYNGILNRVSNSSKKELDCKPICKKILRTKIRSYDNEVTDFYGQKVPKMGSNYNYLPVTLLDSVLKKDGNY